ncbi:hypothetical protein HYV79_04960 [Candidatus Woesearchaeota archaeon]|nr:hypothetical protein [Candidatus Woesearchaeota archaeon]
MNNKAMLQAPTLVVSMLVIILLFSGFFLTFSQLSKSTLEIKSQEQDLQVVSKALSLFQQNIDGILITELIIKGNVNVFSKLVKDVYGATARCRLIIDGKNLDVGCLDIDEPPVKVKLEVPYINGEIYNILFEVVS